MYQVSIFNNGVETVIHTPNPDKDAPHLLELPFKESLSQAEQLSFSIPYGNPGYDKIEGLLTKVKVVDTRDNTVVFSGRVVPRKDGMTSEGQFTKQVTCEGAMNYLVDTTTRRWVFNNNDPAYILGFILNKHNEKVDDSRKIYPGIIQLTQPITISTNYEKTLNAIISKLKNILGGDLRVQERNSILYLDYLTAQGANNNVEIRIGRNLKSIVREYDPSDVITRAIPMGYGEGINQLDITTVNNGVDYIQDNDAVTKYGVIEGLITNKDIQDPNTLLLYGQEKLNQNKQPRFTYTQEPLDLSVLPGRQNERYDMGDTIHTIVELLNLDVYARVIERDRDLINSPWAPKLTISTRPIQLSDQMVDLRQRSQTLENAPQGSTYIDTYGYAENVDANHNFQLPVWISPDVLNVNRVRLHIDGQKYRAYEKGMASGGGTLTTTSSGGGATVTSTSGGSSSTTSTSPVDKWGPYKSIGNPYQPTTGAENILSLDPVSDGFIVDGYYTQYDSNGQLAMAVAKSVIEGGAELYAWVDMYRMQHQHKFTVTVPNHNHSVGVPDHAHSVNVPDHSHTVNTSDHQHELDYGIFEDTYPRAVYIKINGELVAGAVQNIDSNDVAQAFSVDLDLTEFMNQPGQTYNLELTSSQNGRLNVWVSIQAFIQAK